MQGKFFPRYCPEAAFYKLGIDFQGKKWIIKGVITQAQTGNCRCGAKLKNCRS